MHSGNTPFSTYTTPHPEHTRNDPYLPTHVAQELGKALRDNHDVVSRADLHRRYGALMRS